MGNAFSPAAISSKRVKQIVESTQLQDLSLVAPAVVPARPATGATLYLDPVTGALSVIFANGTIRSIAVP